MFAEHQRCLRASAYLSHKHSKSSSHKHRSQEEREKKCVFIFMGLGSASVLLGGELINFPSTHTLIHRKSKPPIIIICWHSFIAIPSFKHDSRDSSCSSFPSPASLCVQSMQNNQIKEREKKRASHSMADMRCTIRRAGESECMQVCVCM